MHALHTVHALPDLRVAAGRLRDVFYHALLFATADLRLPFCPRSKPIFEVRGAKLTTCEDHCRVSTQVELCNRRDLARPFLRHQQWLGMG